MKLLLEPPAWATELLSDMTDMDRDPLPLAQAGAVQVEYELPDDAYFEYAYRHPDGRILGDPGNRERAASPWFPNASAVFGPAYTAGELAAPPDEPAQGTTTRLRFQSEVLPGEPRRVTVYTPAGHEGKELPLVMVQDGVAFYRLARLHQVADALNQLGATRPARFAFVEPHDRNEEYGFSPAYRTFLAEELLQKLDTEFPTTGERIWLGASLGGLLSATVALTYPQLVSSVVSFSGAFLGTPQEREFYRTDRSWLLDQLKGGATPPPRWYLEVGSLEWLTDVNRQVAQQLAGAGVQSELTIRNAGHNWTSWRNGLAAALRFVLAT
ncbi:MAG: alpha/beta fold hydrolase [Trueperaceae bacterium]